MPNRPTPLGDDEIAAIFARLWEETYRRPPAGAGEGGPSVARDEAERFWAVTAERRAGEVAGSGVRSFVLRPVRAVLRPMMRWYVEPALAEQRRFNAAVLELLDELLARQRQDERSPEADTGA